MKIKNKNIYDFANTSFGNKHLPARLSLAIAVNAEEADKKLKAYHETRVKLAKDHAKKDENGEPVIQDGRFIFEDPLAWDEVFKELINTEIDMPVTTVPMDEIIKCDDPQFDSLTVHELAVLGFMIEK